MISNASVAAAFLQLYAAFLRRLGEFTEQDKEAVDVDILRSLGETVPILVENVSLQTGSNKIYRSRFSLDAVSLLRTRGSRVMNWDGHLHGGFWTGLLSSAEMECDHGRTDELDLGFILEALTSPLS